MLLTKLQNALVKQTYNIIILNTVINKKNDFCHTESDFVRKKKNFFLLQSKAKVYQSLNSGSLCFIFNVAFSDKHLL